VLLHCWLIRATNSNGTPAALIGWRQGIVKPADNAADPGRVARSVLHALTAKRPQSRYTVGIKAKLKLLIWKFLPETLKDMVIRRPARRENQGNGQQQIGAFKIAGNDTDRRFLAGARLHAKLQPDRYFRSFILPQYSN